MINNKKNQSVSSALHVRNKTKGGCTLKIFSVVVQLITKDNSEG